MAALGFAGSFVKILIVADWYLPGFKAGGLITALSNLVDSIGDTFELFIFTRDRDLTDTQPYFNIRRDEWQTLGRARILYTSDLSFRHIRKRIFQIMPDIIYLNSFFSVLTVKVLCLRKLGLLPVRPMVLAPRGELSQGALAVKNLKKYLYKNVALRAGLYRGLLWQATSSREAQQITVALHLSGCAQPSVRVASDLFSRDWLRAASQPPKPPKAPGARFLCVSRISPLKNILFALEILRRLEGPVEFDIFGPIDDQKYWRECQNKMSTLPSNVVVRYSGLVPRARVPQIALQYDFFLLPTQSESFGFAILEALAAGCPVVISDQTPWQNLAEKGAGWVLPLSDSALWRRILQECVEMGRASYASMSQHARGFVENWARSSTQREDTVQLFDLALHGQHDQPAQPLRAERPLAESITNSRTIKTVTKL